MSIQGHSCETRASGSEGRRGVVAFGPRYDGGVLLACFACGTTFGMLFGIVLGLIAA